MLLSTLHRENIPGLITESFQLHSAKGGLVTRVGILNLVFLTSVTRVTISLIRFAQNIQRYVKSGTDLG